MPGTTSINPRIRGGKWNELDPREIKFVTALMASTDFNASAAARSAGYKNPGQMAAKLLQRPNVKAVLGKEISRSISESMLTREEVIKYLEMALFYNPLKLFTPGEGGGWLIGNPADIPDEIGRMIEKVDVKIVEREDGETITTFKIEMISKSTVLQYAMKHLGMLEEKGFSLSASGETAETLLATLLQKAEESETNLVDANFIEEKANE